MRQEADRIDPVLAYLKNMGPSRNLVAKAVAMRLRAAHLVDTQIQRDLARSGTEIWELELVSTLLCKGGSLPIGQLQDATQLTAGVIINRITKLERGGHATRAVDPDGRRQIIVTLTDEGRKHAALARRPATGFGRS
jgi:DNA-binding MarR family transcriptional regulator